MKDYLAIYAAFLSTIVFAWNVLQSKSRFRVDLIFGAESNSGKKISGAYIIVRNVSSRDIHLSSIGYLFPYSTPSVEGLISHMWRRKRISLRVGWINSRLSDHGISNYCPVTVEAGKSYSVFLPESAIRSMLAKAIKPYLIVCARDELWSTAYSRPLDCSFAK